MPSLFLFYKKSEGTFYTFAQAIVDKAKLDRK